MTALRWFLQAWAVLVLAGGVSAVALAQDEPAPREKGFRFESEVLAIPVPVFVTDDDGNPITDLTQEDFVLEEEGKVRPITFFRKVDYEQLSVEREQGKLGPLPPGMRRQFLLLFDLTFSSARGLIRARDAALSFMDDKLLPEDLVAVATYSSLGGLKMLTSFSTDRVHARYMVTSMGLEQATHLVQDQVGFVFDLVPFKQGPAEKPQEMPDFDAMLYEYMRTISERMRRSDEDAYRAHAASYFGQFSALNAALRSMSGRKYILLFSEGVESQYVTGTGVTRMDDDFVAFMNNDIQAIDPENRFGRADLRDSLYEGLRNAVAADTVVHALDVSGLGGDTSDNVDTTGGGRNAMQPGTGAGGGQDTLFIMADETGGDFYRNLNDLEVPLQKILSESRFFYLLAFEPRDPKNNGRFRKIEVDVKRDDVHISARKGYYEPDRPDKIKGVERSLQIAEVVSKDLLLDDVYFDVLLAAYPGQGALARIPVFLQFPGQQFLEGALKAKDVLELEIYGYVTGEDGKFLDFFNHQIAFDVKREHARLEATGIKYYDLLFAQPGPVRVKLIVRDKATGLMGSFIEDLDVPDFSASQLAMAPPLFVEEDDAWLMVRGFDPLKPDERRAGMPVSYPFVAEGQEFIPDVLPTFDQKEPSFAMIRVYNLQLHPQTGQPQTEMKFQYVGPDGKVSTLPSVGLAKRPTEPEANCFELIFKIDWTGVAEGPGMFRMTLTDSMSKATVTSASAFVLQP